MIKPAILFKDELDKMFAAQIYSERYFYYVGYAYGFELPNIRAQDHYYQWDILDNNDKYKIAGYLAYHIDPLVDSIDRFGLYSFDEGNLKVVEEVYNILTDLCKNHHRVEWHVIEGNHAKRGYDNFIKKMSESGYETYTYHFHDITKDPKGNIVGEYTYEIINPNK